jgi:biopolymer transport protein ExbD
MGAAGRVTATIAILLILLGIAVPTGYGRWMSTRTFVALDQHVSLSPGHIRTADFDVNLAGWYQVGVDVDRGFPYRPGCGFGALDPLLKTRSIVYRGGRELGDFEGADRFLGHFYAEKRKQYSLDIQVLTDASCFNSGHPRIFVWRPSAGYEFLYDELLTLSLALVLSGLGTLAFSTATLVGKRTKPQDQFAIAENQGFEYYPSRRKLLLRPLFSQPPSFGLVYALVLAVVLIPSFGIFIYAWGYDHLSVGIRVQIQKSWPLKTFGDSSSSPVVVRVEGAGSGSRPRLYLNSKLVAFEQLGSWLTAELNPRSDRVVYFQSSGDVEWGDAVGIMDIIRGTGAKVVLLTEESTAPLPQSP